jgi:EAL domain-containing protein (putative c-di-GMP-specific phosphodiesterase class I)/PAS domain-containing protein
MDPRAMNPARQDVLEDLSEIVRRVPVGVVTFDDSGAVLVANPPARQLLRPLVDNQALENVFTLMQSLCPELAGKVAAFPADSGVIIDQRQIEGRESRQTITVSLTVSRLRTGVHLAVLRDVTRLTEMIAFAFASAEVLIDLDPDGTISWAGGAFRSLLDMQPQDAIGKPLSLLISPRDRDTLAQALGVIAGRGRLAPLLLRLANPSEDRCVISGMMLAGPHPRYLLTMALPPATDVAPPVAMRGGHDFQIEAKTWVRTGRGGMLGLLDIKDWDSAAAGLDDTRRGALKHMIGRLAAEAGAKDVVLGEIGGGRFGILGRGDTDMARLGSALGELVASFADGKPAEVRQARIGLDAGLLSISQSVNAMRLALSRFGAAGMEGVEALGITGDLPGIIEQVNSQKRILAALIAEGRFGLLYQPVVALHDRSVHHYEALLRLPPNALAGGMGTQDFVTMVETVGLSTDLDLAVLRRAVAVIRQTGASVAVNVSGRSVTSPTFAQKLMAEIVGLPPRRMLIEITETAEIEDMAAAAMQINRLRAAHVGVCLDDFGAGGASFRYVRDLKVDYLKIDGAFVRAAGEGQQGRAFIRAMRDLAASSEARTVAEMIETEADLALMLDLGIDYGQGYLFGRPAPIPARGGGGAGQPGGGGHTP